jgi:predicted metalloprotease with PDZ domain
MPDPASQHYQVALKVDHLEEGFTDFKIPTWMPGYYQVLQYPEKIQNFQVVASDDIAIKWEKANDLAGFFSYVYSVRSTMPNTSPMPV